MWLWHIKNAITVQKLMEWEKVQRRFVRLAGLWLEFELCTSQISVGHLEFAGCILMPFGINTSWLYCDKNQISWFISQYALTDF
jgi:hypothetical protein